MKTSVRTASEQKNIQAPQRTPAASGKSKAVQLQDNRPKTVAQRRLIEDMAVNNTVMQKKANNTGLPDNLKTGVENLSGYSMDDVKVHYNSAKPAQLQALAYAQGTDIHIAPGQEKHLPHEAWHVVQQKQGRVKPTLQMKAGINVNDNKGLEREADTMGRKAGTLTRFSENGSRSYAENSNVEPIISNVGKGLQNNIAQCLSKININKQAYSPLEAAEYLIKHKQAGSRSYEQIIKVLTDKSLQDDEMTFRSFFALGWFVERQYDRISGLSKKLMPKEIKSVKDLEQTLDYLCGSRWWYVGGYAALLWMEELGLQKVSTDDLDIAIGGEKEYEAVTKHFPKALWLEHTQKIDGYSVQFIGRNSAEPARMHRFGSKNVLIPEIIIQGYTSEDTKTQILKGPMGIGGMAAAAAAAARKTNKMEEPEESPEKQKKKEKRALRVKLLNSILNKY